MSHMTGLVIEGLVAVLLVLTIGYCMVLNSRLKRLKADEMSLKATIGELITATEIAERAIAGLKLTVRDCDENLGSRLASASELSERMGKQITQGEEIMRRLSRIAVAARPKNDQQPAAAEQPSPSSARSIAAAVQALNERRRTNGLAA
jgi:chromosome segregation ATPase